MNTLEAIAKRHSTRAYRGEQIPEEALQAILRAGFAAPVAMAKYETLHITVVQGEELLGRIHAATGEMFYRRMGVRKNTDFGAKTILLVSSANSMLPQEMALTSVGIVVESMVLAATDLGIQSVILGGAPAAIGQDEALMSDLQIPEGFRPILGVAMGYAESEEPAKEHVISVNRV